MRGPFIFLAILVSVLYLRDINFKSSEGQQFLFKPFERILSPEGVRKACSDISANSVVSSLDNRSSMKSITDMILSSRGGNQLIPLSKSQNSSTFADYIKTFLPIFIALGILLILTFFGWTCYCCYCCCKCCPICCRVREEDQRPVTKRQKCCLGGVSILLVLLMMAAGILALITNEYFKYGYNSLRCSLYTSFNDFVYGLPAQNPKNITWIGVEGVANRLNILYNKLQENGQKFSTYFSDFKQFEKFNNDSNAKINSLYQDNYQKTVRSPNPSVTTKVQPDIIKVIE